MTTMMREDCLCSLCGALNRRGILASTNNFGGMDTEFRSHAIGLDPLTLFVQTCSSCGYTAYDLDKALPDTAAPKVRESVEQFYASEKLDKTAVPTYKQYELLASIMEVECNTDEEVEETLLRAAWTAEDNNQKLLARKYRKTAAELLEKQLMMERDESIKAEKQFQLAEIYRRSGEFKLGISTQNKIIKDRLHPELQRAVPRLMDLLEKKKDEKMMFADLRRE